MRNTFLKVSSYYLLVLVTVMIASGARAQNDTLRVLFLGNSYTAANNLPQLVADLADADNKKLIFDSYTPGGTLLWNFANNMNTSNQLDTTALHKIKSGNWDFVVLQEQSQVPTIDHYRYNYMYPSVEKLKDTISQYNPCAKIMLFMTWGRQNGGIQCSPDNYCSPEFVDFSHMQDSLESAYMGAAGLIKANVAPVGIAWKKVIEDTSIVLHSSDESHPNYKGSYLAACVFHAALWDKSPVGLSFTGSLTNPLAEYLQKTADSVVFNSYSNWNLDAYDVSADFTFDIFQDSVQFTNQSQSQSPVNYYWDFGDGTTETTKNPGHTYNSDGNYLVTLITDYCSTPDTTEHTVTISTTGLQENQLQQDVNVFPNPVKDILTVISDRTLNNVTVEIMNMFGQKVHVESIDTNLPQKINLETLPDGLYLITIENRDTGQKANFKLLKE
ncbi:MAG: PKD domain-containing protein [Bacteroidales bacterium]|nr:PKD domain-containing protein [Bacteroidales bacterium]MCF8328046.1 PKD domain-containing protein [Bacteroidales bacterium]